MQKQIELYNRPQVIPQKPKDYLKEKPWLNEVIVRKEKKIPKYAIRPLDVHEIR